MPPSDDGHRYWPAVVGASPTPSACGSRRQPAARGGCRRKSGGAGMNRLLVVRCPDLLDEDEGGAALRSFDRVIGAVEAYCPWVTAVRPGICSLPARGPARYFGGEGPLAQRITEPASDITPVEVGVADGLFAAVLAARRRRGRPGRGAPLTFWPPFRWASSASPNWPSCWTGWASAPWASSPPCPRPMCSAGSEPTVSSATGWPGGGAGSSGGLRQPLGDRRTGPAQRDVRGDRSASPEFWGGVSDTDARPAGPWPPCRTSSGPDGVVTARLQGGRGPAQRARFVTWGGRGGADPDTALGRAVARPDPTAGPGRRASRPPAGRAGRRRRGARRRCRAGGSSPAARAGCRWRRARGRR